MSYFLSLFKKKKKKAWLPFINDEAEAVCLCFVKQCGVITCCLNYENPYQD